MSYGCPNDPNFDDTFDDNDLNVFDEVSDLDFHDAYEPEFETVFDYERGVLEVAQ